MTFQRLSKIRKPERFCYCQRCNEGYQNDVNTNHPICPKCGVGMMNMSKEAVEVQIEKERKTRKELAK